MVGLCADHGRCTSMAGYHPSASMAASAASRLVTASGIAVAVSVLPSTRGSIACMLGSIVAQDAPPDSEREILSWPLFGEATRSLAQTIADDRFEPDIVLASDR